MAEMSQAEKGGHRPCLLCGSPNEPSVEHIIPQALWKRFGLDPDQDELAQFRTDLCITHNQATSVLHQRSEMMDLIETGSPVTKKTLQHLGDWIVWITLLLSLARGRGVLGVEASRQLLLRRFDKLHAGTPKGVRVYAAVVDDSVEPTESESTPYVLALKGDSRVLLNEDGAPIGFSVREGPVNASESIRLGRVALLVVGSTYSSGDDHEQRLDDAVARVGLERIFPPERALPKMEPTPIDMTDVGQLFTVIPDGADGSLMPEALRAFATWDDPGF
jgi:hypothetical protein